MNLSKATRKALHEAKAPIWIPWPESAPEARWGRWYRVSSKGHSFHILIEGTRNRGTEVLAKIDDPPAVLWGLKGIRNSEGKYESEPEPVKGEWLERRCLVARQTTVMLGLSQRDKAKAQKSGKGKLAAEHTARADDRLKKVVGL